MTVWIWPCSKRYYLLRPWRWFEQLFDNIRAAWMRMTKGYCYGDIWNFNTWFSEVAPEMLKHMAEFGHGYPDFEPFENPEKWHDWLIDMANRIKECGEEYFEYADKRNKYSPQFEAVMDNAAARWRRDNPDKKCDGYELTDEEEELRIKYLDEEKEIMEKRTVFIQDTFTELGKYYDCLWD